MNQATQVMSTHGKSFYFASLFFPREQFAKIALLYMICRRIDDTADELKSSESLPALSEIRAQIADPHRTGQWRTLIAQVEEQGVERTHLLDLMTGAEFDARGGVISDEATLLKYCYWVAGVVGLMMCPILRAQDARAQQHAKSLGIGMQLTNICRDVKSDAKAGRIYLPMDRVQQTGLTLEDLQSDVTPEKLKNLVGEYLDLADTYYQHGYEGLAYLPFRSRLCIVLAGEVYRHIGVKIRRKNYQVLEGRIYLSYLEKIGVALKCLRFFIHTDFWRMQEKEA